MTDDSRLNELEPYLPSSSEKKQAVLMYMVAWLVLSMWKREVSPFTHHHIKQSLGWLFAVVLVIFADFVLFVVGIILSAASWVFFSFFAWVAVLLTVPILAVGFMCMYQATKWKYIWESEYSNKFFALFSGMWNRVLNLFDANHYQIVDEYRYRAEDQYYGKGEKKDGKTDATKDENKATTQNLDDLNNQNQPANNSTSGEKTLDNNQEVSINNQSIWIDLSNHEINKPENQV